MPNGRGYITCAQCRRRWLVLWAHGINRGDLVVAHEASETPEPAGAPGVGVFVRDGWCVCFDCQPLTRKTRDDLRRRGFTV